MSYPVSPYGAQPGPSSGSSSLGDITVAGDQILTPVGPIPLRGAVWTVNDMSRVERKIPTHAIVLAVIFAWFCLLGLLFLLMKEDEVVGHLQVSVHNDGKAYQTNLLALSGANVMWIHQQVNYFRSLSAS